MRQVMLAELVTLGAGFAITAAILRRGRNGGDGDRGSKRCQTGVLKELSN